MKTFKFQSFNNSKIKIKVKADDFGCALYVDLGFIDDPACTGWCKCH